MKTKDDFYDDLDREIQKLMEEFGLEHLDTPDPDIPIITLCGCGHHLVSPFEDATAAHRRWEERFFN